MCLRKDEGGLGVRGLKEFYLTPLGKWWCGFFMRGEVYGTGCYVPDNTTLQVGDGESTLFCTDPWIDGEPLCKVYVRLFELSENKLELVANTMTRGWGIDKEAWMWCRSLFPWEEELLGECAARLTSVTLQSYNSNKSSSEGDSSVNMGDKNNTLDIVNDKGRSIREYAVFDLTSLHTSIVKSEVTTVQFEFKPIMFQILQPLVNLQE
ncbi:hypothetical protein MTR_3g012200 [Medicago truncatula]|uniref:Uncharacterized protein n=1 Tax=Medicago truncatula TaxID=3880 RepID=A0A072UUE5_MEDTR|nr:hypothetical protein MTR_3g012200 [Medicago truncatula]